MQGLLLQFIVIPLVLFKKIAPKRRFQVVKHEFLDNTLENLEKRVLCRDFGV